MDVKDLPDYPALKKLATALWQTDGTFHGAAVLVGAGFSRAAAKSGDDRLRLPLWFNLAKALGEDLKSSTLDPLRVAEEYHSYFGAQAMHDVLKLSVNDPAWTPGPMHESLLALPWSEVLTTNWDTLLERAAPAVDGRVYSMVRKQEDLASSRSPRIVKLHGTIGLDSRLVFTQEDYRRYPATHAAFVNFARQVFIENELCLVGFSGDDPNFLEWAGWVRDHLAGSVRRIFLVGALSLTAAKRKYLETINVAPIDLTDLVADCDDPDHRHVAATEIFLRTLHSLKPAPAWNWPIASPPLTRKQPQEIQALIDSQAWSAFSDYAEILKTEREKYPGWLVCPSQYRRELLMYTGFHLSSKRVLDALPISIRERLIYEQAWRHSRSYDFVGRSFAEQCFVVCSLDSTSDLSKRERAEIALLLLRHKQRIEADDAKWAELRVIVEDAGKYWTEALDELTYQEALVARDKFDYDELKKKIALIRNESSLWKLRKSSLLAELGLFDEGEALVSEAYRELLILHRENKRSILIFSQLAWAHWLSFIVSWEIRKAVRFPSIYHENKCNPWDIRDELSDAIVNEIDDQRGNSGYEAAFLPGRYRDKNRSHSISGVVHPLLVTSGLLYDVGLPIRWRSKELFVDQISKLLDVEGVSGVESFSLAIRAASSDTSNVIKKVFNRMSIACFSQVEVDFLYESCMNAVNYWIGRLKGSKEDNYAEDRLRVFLEVLARVSVRLHQDEAKKLFLLGVEFSKNKSFQHLWLQESLSHLLEYSLLSIPESEHWELLLEALEVPLVSEISRQDAQWPNPVIRIPGTRINNAGLDRRINEIILAVKPGGSAAGPLLRLLPLIKSEYLTDREIDKLIIQLWGEDGEETVLRVETRLYIHSTLQLPSRNRSRLEDKCRTYLFESPIDSLLNPGFLEELVNSGQALEQIMWLTSSQADRYFDALTNWRPSTEDRFAAMFGGVGSDKRTADLIGRALSYVVVPRLSNSDRIEKFSRLVQFHEATNSAACVVSLVFFADVPELTRQIEKTLRLSLQAQDSSVVNFAARAVMEWRLRSDCDAAKRLVSIVVFLLGTHRINELPVVIDTLERLFEQEALTSEEIASIDDVLPIIFHSAKYDSFSQDGRVDATISLVRAGCVKLARALLRRRSSNSELENILLVARSDALPEVRFA